MGLHKLTAGDGYTYLTRSVAAHDATRLQPGGLEAYYAEKGEAPGVWWGAGFPEAALTAGERPPVGPGTRVTEAQMIALFGSGRNPDAERIEHELVASGVSPRQAARATQLGRPFPQFDAANEFRQRCSTAYAEHNINGGQLPRTSIEDTERARIRTGVATTMFTERYRRPPMDERELSGFLAKVSRPATTAVAGYDLTFSPVKSVSALWAIAPPEIAEQIAACHAEAVEATASWLQDHAGYSRRGAGGVRQVEIRGLMAAAFVHRDSRAGDPDLHTHLAVSNKVQALDGTWLSLDGRALYANKVAASEHYDTRLAALLTDRLGVTFTDKPAVDGKRAVREIEGMDPRLLDLWSSRRAAITARTAVLAQQFQQDHHRPPTSVEALALGQQATLETRQAKHEPRSLQQQRSTWRAEAAALLGSEAAVDKLAARLAGQAGAPVLPVMDVTRLLAPTAAAVIGRVEQDRATWQEHHVRAEAERQVRPLGLPVELVDGLVDLVVATVLSPEHSLLLSPALSDAQLAALPAALRRTDGSSVYEVAGTRRYSSARILAAEQAVLGLADRFDGRRLDRHAVNLGLLEATANGVTLNRGQVRLVEQLATSGARVQLALAPAGTGKTTALRALAAAWTGSGGTIVGLAPSAAAASVLRDELGSNAVAVDTLAKLLHSLDHPDSPTASPWAPAIDARTLVLVDEAGMAGTADLAALTDLVIARGGSLRLIGDDRQLAAVGAGGLLRDLALHDSTATLTEVVRFRDLRTGAPNLAEAAASQAIRAGDPAGIAYYTDQQRVHVGTRSTALEQAYRAWQSDRLAGLDTVLLAPTREQVTALNLRARADRLAGTAQDPSARQRTLADGTAASAGDVVIARRNERRLALSATDWVKNGDRFTVTAVLADGRLDVRHHGTGKQLTLPAAYAGAHAQLGYATTVHAAQGSTADTAHAVLTGTETRELLYVALTRGRAANHLYLATGTDGDPHTALRPETLRPPTAVEVLSGILDRTDNNESAATLQRLEHDPSRRLGQLAAEWDDAIGVAVDQMLGTPGLARICAVAEQLRPGLTAEPAWPALRDLLALHAVDGVPPERLLPPALTDLAGSRDPAAVAHARIVRQQLPNASADSPVPEGLPWLSVPPRVLRTDPAWAAYLRAHADQLRQAAGDVESQARAWTSGSAPEWATELAPTRVRHHAPSSAGTAVGQLAVWRAAHRIPDTDLRATGPATHAETPAAKQVRRDLDGWAQRQRDTRDATWRRLAESIEPRLPDDPHWPALSRQLSQLEDSGADARQLLREHAGMRPLPDDQPAAALRWRLTGAAPSEDRTRTRPDITALQATLAARPSPSSKLPARPAEPAVQPHRGIRR